MMFNWDTVVKSPNDISRSPLGVLSSSARGNKHMARGIHLKKIMDYYYISSPHKFA